MDLTIQKSTTSGLEVVFTAASGAGDSFTNDGKTMLRVKNADVSDKTITIVSPIACNQGFTHDVSVVVTAGEERDIGLFPRNRFNDENGKVIVTYSDVTSVTIAVISQ